MATIKAVLRTSKERKDGTTPLAIRISEGTKNKYISVGYNIFEKDWDGGQEKVKKSNPNHAYINSLIFKIKTQANTLVLEARLTTDDTNLLQSIKRKKEKKEKSNFFSFAEGYLKDLYTNKKFSRLSAEKSRVKHFKEFINSNSLRFHDIDSALLKKFAIYLKTTHACGERTIMNHMVVIRTIFNRAIEDKVASANDYPFGQKSYQIKFPETMKMGLNEEEVRTLEQADLSDNPKLNHVRNVWLFSFYLAGMRISDVIRLQWKDFTDDRLNYTMGKNKKIVSLKLPDKAAAILGQYKSQEFINNGFVFPDAKDADLKDAENMFKNINRITGKFDRLLKDLAIRLEIKKPLTNHIARHTFGNITGDKISPQMLQKLYRHSHISTTMGYQAHFIHKDVDDALESVLDF